MKHLDKPNWKKKKEQKKTLWLVLLCVFLLVPLTIGAALVYTNFSSAPELEINGATIYVKQGGDLQAAIDRAKSGDTISLQAGATFTGNFNLPKKNGDDFITIRSSAADDKLPPADTRLDPIKYASALAKIVTANSDPVINAINGAHHFRFIGVEFTVAKPETQVWKLITIGDDEQAKIEQVPHHIVFDRCFVHAHPQAGKVRSGISINGSNIEILNSNVSDFRLTDNEGHAIVAWNAPGPFRIVNNFIEASGIGVLFGGATAQKGMNPADLEFRRNLVTKKIEWRGSQSVKNLFELKDMRRATIEENIFENNWASAQDGTAIMLTPASLQSGADARIEDIVFRSNIVRKTANAVTMTGTDYGDPKYPNIPVQNRGVKIENNLFAEIGFGWGDKSAGRFMLLTSGAGPDDLTINHNTVVNSGNFLVLDGGLSKNFVLTNNIGFLNNYGIISVGNREGGIGTAALKGYMTNFIFRKNVLVGADAKRYPPDNFYPSNRADLRFVNFDGGNLQLDNASALRGKAIDGKNIGCDYAAIEAMEKKVLSGINN